MAVQMPDAASVRLLSDQDGGFHTLYLRLTSLLIQEGTDRVRTEVLRHLKDGGPIQTTLLAHQAHLEKLKKKGIISKSQFAILFPKGGQRAKMSDIDMTLWIVLARNITTPGRRINWTSSPKDRQTEWQHDVIRIRDVRNRLFHMLTPELSDDSFLEIRAKLTSSLSRLGCPDDVIDGYFTRDLDRTKTAMHELQLRGQYLQEMYSLSVSAAKTKKQGRLIIVALVVLFVGVVAGVVVPVVVLRQQTPCSENVEWRRVDSGVFQWLSRDGWNAMPADYKNISSQTLHLPVEYVIVLHTAMLRKCLTTTDCCRDVRYVQHLHQDNHGWDDIAYNFMIGGDGTVFEGRGRHIVGAASKHWNNKSISIAFLGNYVCDLPTRAAFNTLYSFLDYLVNQKAITHNYTLYGHCQTSPTFFDSPGAALMQQIVTLDHWRNRTGGNCTMDKDCLNNLYMFCQPPSYTGADPGTGMPGVQLW